jgi:hypothetical protein
LYAEWDDGNPAWEDEPLDPNDPLTEIIWRKDEECNEEADPTDVDEDLAAKGAGMHRNLGRTLVTIAFRKWRATWRHHIISYHRKCREVERHPFSTWIRGHCHGGKYYDVLPPHLVFTIGERAIFQNMMAWMVDGESEGWYELPGPAEWWPENYDFAGSGWDPLNEDLSQEYAFALAMSSGSEVPEEWDRMLPTEAELGLMGHGITSKLLGDWF